MLWFRIILTCGLLHAGISTGIPIWELLTHNEKIGNLTFIFLHLVQLYCKESQIPDCEKVLALYGVSNLLKENEETLDRLDPSHRDSRGSLWSITMNGAFGFPKGGHIPTRDQLVAGDSSQQTEFERDMNTIVDSEPDYSFNENYDDDGGFSERHPYAVRVPPPPNFRGFTPDSNQSGVKIRRNFPVNAQINHQTNYSQHKSRSALNPGRNYSQNSPIIAIAPYDKAEASQGSRQGQLASKNFNRHNAMKPYANRQRDSESNSVYILPSDENREPILLRILKK